MIPRARPGDVFFFFQFSRVFFFASSGVVIIFTPRLIAAASSSRWCAAGRSRCCFAAVPSSSERRRPDVVSRSKVRGVYGCADQGANILAVFENTVATRQYCHTVGTAILERMSDRAKSSPERESATHRGGSRTKRSASSAAAADANRGVTKKRPRTATGLLPRGAVAMFYSKSKDVDDLGLGRPDWRKVLSNFHPVEIEVAGQRYPSVEHAFHAAKARCSSNPEVARQFEVGGSVPSTPLGAKKAGGRAGFAKLGTELDETRWNAQRDAATMAALRARLACDNIFREILATVHSKQLRLVHFERGGAKSYWGGNIRTDDGVIVGRNRLGEMLMELAAEAQDAGTRRRVTLSSGWVDAAVPTPAQLKSRFWSTMLVDSSYPRVVGFYSHRAHQVNGCFSNFAATPFTFELPSGLLLPGSDATQFPDRFIVECSEKAIMLCKAAAFGDSESYRQIARAGSPQSAKQLGRKVRPFDDARWQTLVCHVAREVVYQKFSKLPPLRAHLLATGSHTLAEATRNDQIWGIGLNIDEDISVPARWRGTNVLGWALMQTRDRLRTESVPGDDAASS